MGDLIAEFLSAAGCTTAFGIVSVHNIPILDAIGRRISIRFVPARGEMGGGHMADAYARVSGGLGVLITSTGPGAANALPALVEAGFAGSPVLHVTGVNFYPGNQLVRGGAARRAGRAGAEMLLLRQAAISSEPHSCRMYCIEFGSAAFHPAAKARSCMILHRSGGPLLCIRAGQILGRTTAMGTRCGQESALLPTPAARHPLPYRRV